MPKPMLFVFIMSALANLLPELRPMILCYLSLPTWLALIRINHSWYDGTMTNNDTLWYSLYHRTFPRNKDEYELLVELITRLQQRRPKSFTSLDLDISWQEIFKTRWKIRQNHRQNRYAIYKIRKSSSDPCYCPSQCARGFIIQALTEKLTFPWSFIQVSSSQPMIPQWVPGTHVPAHLYANRYYVFSWKNQIRPINHIPTEITLLTTYYWSGKIHQSTQLIGHTSHMIIYYVIEHYHLHYNKLLYLI
jgi:hypothetical protein